MNSLSAVASVAPHQSELFRSRKIGVGKCGDSSRVQHNGTRPTREAGPPMLSMGSPIYEAPLSTKERNALALLGVSTVGDFLQIDLQQVFRLRGFGDTTYAKLNNSRAQLYDSLFPGPRLPRAEAYPSDDRLHDVLSAGNAHGNDTCHLQADIRSLGLSVAA